jgi:hypothetical protein
MIWRVESYWKVIRASRHVPNVQTMSSILGARLCAGDRGTNLNLHVLLTAHRSISV